MSEFTRLKERQSRIPDETKRYVKKSLDILDRLHELLEEENILQKELALKLNKSESELSKWLNGVQNFTIKTLCKLESALGHDIFIVPNKKNGTIELPIQTRILKGRLLFDKFNEIQLPQTLEQESTKYALVA